MNHWVLDGYNVMHALDFIKKNLPFEIAREQFISWVGLFQTLGDKQVTIVFDDNVHMPGPHELHPRVRVVYSPNGFNADGTMLSIVRQTPSSQRRYLVAVTRDTMLKEAILGYGSTVISPENFANEFAAYRSHTPDAINGVHFHPIDKHFSYQPFKDFFN